MCWVNLFTDMQDYTSERLHAVRIRTLPPGTVKFEVCQIFCFSERMNMLHINYIFSAKHCLSLASSPGHSQFSMLHAQK